MSIMDKDESDILIGQENYPDELKYKWQQMTMTIWR